MEILDISHTDEIYTVSRLNREVRLVLEGSFATLWVEGEISNFVAPNSGHWYFSLKDPLAQIRCAMFRPQNRRLTFTPKDGMQVLIKARVSLYEGRGEFQLLAEYMEEAGVGKLRQEFEALKKRLSAAGLFAEEHKKKLPLLPKTIGVITSATGAAIRDILSVLQRRFACAVVIIYPTLVQGETAAPNIVKMIQLANQRKECDVLILARGGGSLEDLWPFNEEIVAHAIFQSVLPIISGVGHEIDFTIADFVADVRAPTPSAAAELIVPNIEEMLDSLELSKRHLLRLMKQKLQHFQQNLVWIKKHLQQQHPKRRLAEQAQRLDLAEMSLVRLQVKLLTAYQAKLHTLTARLYGTTPRHKIRELQHLLNHYVKIFSSSTLRALHKQQHALGSLAAKLDALSPLSTLKRGYAIATRDRDNHILLRASEVNTGDKIHVRLMEGELGCVVNKKS
ncbi:MAG: exodeoxyribonuclease VII large subunit [Gammaproteobacteria bacterium]